MILRNSAKSVLRSPLKSILFFLLVFALTAALTLGTALVAMCDSVLAQCDKTYTTIAALEYRGGRFPDNSVCDLTAASLREQIDFDALSRLGFVKQTDRSNTAIVSLPDLNRVLAENSSAEKACVMEIYSVNISKNYVQARVGHVLYSETLRDGAFVSLHSDYNFEPGKRYLISGFSDGASAGISEFWVGTVSNPRAEAAGLTQPEAVLELTEKYSPDSDDPRFEPFRTAADAYNKINHSWYARICPDPSMLEQFVNREYSVREGALYTAADAAEGLCCLLDCNIADRWEVGPGDTVTLILTCTELAPLADSFWPGADSGVPDADKDGVELTVKISGVITTTSREIPPIFLSALPELPGGAETECFSGYNLGTLKLKNGVSSAQIRKLKAMLPEGAEVTVYDQGYSSIAEALGKLRSDAVGVTVAAAVAALAMLTVFAYVFVGRQSNAAVSMYLMGTPVSGLTLYVAGAAALILLPAAALGSFAAYRFSNTLSRLVTRTVESGQSAIRMYSSADLGITKEAEFTAKMSPLPGIICAAATVLAGIAICLVFLFVALRAVSARAYEVKKPRKAEKAGRGRKLGARIAEPLPFSGPAKKYVLISFLRGGIRGAVMLLAAAIMAVFILVPAHALTQSRRQLSALNEGTQIDCYLTDYAGKRRYELVINDNMLSALEESEYFDEFHFSLSDSYLVSSVIRAGEEPVVLEEPPSGGGFSYENYVSNFLNGPKMFYTDSIDFCPEFVGRTKAEVTWLDGYDAEYFEQKRLNEAFRNIRYSRGNICQHYGDLRELCTVVPDSFLEEYGLRLGDEVTLLISDDLVYETYKIIGSFRGVSSSNFIYTRLNNSPKVLKDSPMLVRVRMNASSCSFRLKDTLKLQEAKQWLYDSGYSRVHTAGFYRLYPIFEDQEYCEAKQKLERNIGFLEKLLPALAVLLAAAGLAASVLMAVRKQVEIATLRSIGETGFRVFLIFAAEQLLPALLGTAAGMLLWRIFAGGNPAWFLAPAFFAGFLAGTVAALIRLSGTNLLDVLSEKE
ncbi:MAG: hypothetical protein IJM24_01025 [Clostridia bacterium]|nr:hypothetical protein [Clostridia bacterium]